MMTARKPRQDAELMRIGMRMKQLREAAGLSQPALAELTGIPLPSLRNWEHGKREPGALALELLAAALKIDPGELHKPPDPNLITQPAKSGRPRKPKPADEPARKKKGGAT